MGHFGNIGLSFVVNLVFSHNAAFFILLDYKLCFRLLEKVNYIPQTILITLAVIFTVLNAARTKGPINKKLLVSKEQSDTNFKEKTFKIE